MAEKITKGMPIDEVLKKYPKATAVFMSYGLHCVGCPMAESETIEEVAESHQVDLKKLLEDLNKACLPVGKAIKR